MKKYEIYYCFLDKNNAIETDRNGNEQVYTDIIEAYNGGEALDKLKEKENFKVQPEILQIKEIKNERII